MDVQEHSRNPLEKSHNSSKGFSLVWLLALAVVFSFEPALAQNITWQQTKGPNGASAWALLVRANDEVFVGTDGGGVFRSSNHGETWTDTTLKATHVLSLASNGQGDLFAGTVFEGVYRSRDNGQTWTQFDSGLVKTGAPGEPRYAVPSIVVTANGHLLAGTGDYVQGFTGKGIVRSVDNGETWTQASPAFAESTVPALVLGTDGKIYAGTIGRGVYRSDDGGGSWVQSGLNGLGVTSLVILPNGKILAGIERGGVYASTNGGGSWTDTGLLNTGLGVHAVAANAIGHVFAGTRGAGLFRSLNGGATWVPVNSGMQSTDIRAIAFNSRGAVFVANWGWVERSDDNGENWRELLTGLAATAVRSLSFNSAGVLYASNDGFSGAVFRSLDLGESWGNLGFKGDFMQTVVCAPDGSLYAGSVNGIFRSRDGGASWEDINHGLSRPMVCSIAMNPQEHLFIGTGHLLARSGGLGVFRSVDHGASWTNVSLGLADLQIWSLAIPGNGDILASTNHGLYRSRDNGESWSRLETGLQDWFGQIAVNTSNGHLFAAAGGHGVVRSNDHGNSWTLHSEGLPRMGGISSVLVDAKGRVFAAGYGVFRSLDEGVSWEEISVGLNNRNVEAIALSPDGYLFAGTWANGVFRTVEPVYITVGISPAAAMVPPLGSQAFTASVIGGPTGVAWSVDETGGGSVSSEGVYRAPATLGTYHVRVTSNADPASFARATVRVSPVTMFVVAPTTATVLAGGTLSLSGSVNTGTILWVASGGSLSDSTGTSLIFTAPGATGTCTVTATASADTSQTKTITIRVKTRDQDGNGTADVLDLAYFARSFGASDGPCDLNGDGIVDDLDITIFLSGF